MLDRQQVMSERNFFKFLLSDSQLKSIEEYFQVKQMPNRREKLDLSQVLDIDPFTLNKWFQSRRNKEKYLQRQLANNNRRFTSIFR